MGTVGIAFGAATSGAGFDVASTVTAILDSQLALEDPWKAQLTSLKAQDTALTGLGTDLSSLSTALSSLNNFDGLFASKQGSSSDTNVLTLTSASLNSVAGSHTIQVNSLASTASVYSDNVANANDTLSGTLTFTVGGGAAQSIPLDSANNTLTKLAAAINNGSYGVSASVVTSTTGSRLSIVSSTSGAAGSITGTSSLTDATTSTAVNINQGQSGADAVLTIDGLSTTSASNTVTGAIPGVTFQLLSAPLNTPVQVQITNDNSSVETGVQALVTAYNTVLKDIKTQEGNDATGAAQPLYGSPTLSLLQNQLSSGLFSGIASGKIGSITQLGITAGQDGTLTLDSSVLDTALNAHFGDVTGFFQNTGSFGQNLTTTLNNLGSSFSTGAVSLALDQNAAEETSLNKNVTDEDARIAAQKISLTAELNVANQILQSIPQQLASINEIYSATTGYNQQK